MTERNPDPWNKTPVEWYCHLPALIVLGLPALMAFGGLIVGVLIIPALDALHGLDSYNAVRGNEWWKDPSR